MRIQTEWHDSHRPRSCTNPSHPPHAHAHGFLSSSIPGTENPGECDSLPLSAPPHLVQKICPYAHMPISALPKAGRQAQTNPARIHYRPPPRVKERIVIRIFARHQYSLRECDSIPILLFFFYFVALLLACGMPVASYAPNYSFHNSKVESSPVLPQIDAACCLPPYFPFFNWKLEM